MTNTNETREERIYREAISLARDDANAQNVVRLIQKSGLRRSSRREVLERVGHGPYQRNSQRGFSKVVAAEALLEAAKMTSRFFCCLDPGCFSSSQTQTCRQRAYFYAASEFADTGRYDIASELFVKANELDHAAEMAEKANNPLRAAKIYERFAEQRFREASWNSGLASRECYLPELERAISLYEKSGENRKVKRATKTLRNFVKTLANSPYGHEREASVEYNKKLEDLENPAALKQLTGGRK